MAHFDFEIAFVLCLLVALSVCAWRLVLAIWHERLVASASIAASLLLALLAIQALPSAGTHASPILVAGASERRVDCASLDRVNVGVSGARVRLSGTGSSEKSCGVWAVIADPRTGRHWVQGPAVRTLDGWSLDLVLGVDAPAAEALSYQVALMDLPGDAHELWRSIILYGSPVALIQAPPPGWLPPTFEVTVGS